jgi:hypothetical protein
LEPARQNGLESGPEQTPEERGSVDAAMSAIHDAEFHRIPRSSCFTLQSFIYPDKQQSVRKGGCNQPERRGREIALPLTGLLRRLADSSGTGNAQSRNLLNAVRLLVDAVGGRG